MAGASNGFLSYSGARVLHLYQGRRAAGQAEVTLLYAHLPVGIVDGVRVTHASAISAIETGWIQVTQDTGHAGHSLLNNFRIKYRGPRKQ